MLHNSHTLSLYCDNRGAPWVPYRQDRGEIVPPEPGQHMFGTFPTLFQHAEQKECLLRAKRAGWKFYRDGRTLCPGCVAAGIKLLKAAARAAVE